LLLIAPRPLLDIGVRELVDVHLPSRFVWVNCWAVEEELDQSRAYLFGRTARSAMFACMEMASCALVWAISCGGRVGVAAAAAAGGAGDGDAAAFQVLTSCECVPWHFPSAWFQHSFPC
jgi:hypothetical protein